MTARRIFNRDRTRRRRAALGIVAACLVALLAVAGATTSFAAEAISARAGLHAGYARMAFDLPAGLGHSVEADGTKLTIAFDRPVGADLASLRRILGDRLAAVSIVDGRIEATMARAYEIREFVHEGALVVDLIAGRTETSGLRVGVRVGEHPTFTRLVFDWPSTVDYRLDSDGPVARIRFRRPAEIVVPSRAVAAAPRIAALVASAPAEGETAVALTFDGRLRHFRDGFKVVVDVLDAPRPAAEAPKTAKATPAQPPVPVEKPAPAAAPVASADAPEEGAPDAPDIAPAADLRRAVAPLDLTQAMAAGGAEAAQDAVHPALPGPTGGPMQLLPAVLQDQGQAEPALAPAAAAPGPVAALPENVETLPVEVEVDLDGVALGFPFIEDVGAAVFRRGGHLWLVFDKVYRIDTGRIAEPAREFVQEIEQLPDSRATVLRIVTVPGYNALVARDGNRWEAVLVPQLLKPDVAMQVETHLGAVSTVSVGPSAPGAVLRVADPAVGDEIRVGTLRVAGNGVARRHQFADFRLLPSVQGVAVVPLSDRVDLRAGQDRLIVSAAGGLRLTDAAARARVLASADRGDGFARFFDFEAWRHGELGSFDHAERELLARIGRAEEGERNPERLELARFYLSHGLADRAQGILDLVSGVDPDIARVPSFKALRGAARYVIGDQAGAERDLFERDLDGEPEIVLWRAAVRGVEGDYVNGSLGLQQSERYVQAYPDALRKRFAFLGAELSIAQNDPVGAGFWLDVIKDAPLTAADEERIRVYRAGIAAQHGEVDTAIQLYDRAIAGRDRLSRALATLQKTELLLREEVITPLEAVEMLDRLRYVWRGDGLEFRILRRLGELEIAAGRYRDGFATLKRAAANFPEHPGAPEIADEMRTAFRKLYLDGAADDLPPVTAIALFEEFRELAPAGEAGDEMIRRLADRMVSVDLLAQAADLLEHLVEYRLEGPVKGAVGGRLAMIHLLDRQPDAALAALAASDVNGMTLEEVDARTLVAARAEVLRGDYPRALSTIAGMAGPDADRLRAEIFWRQQDWDRAATLYGRLAGPAPEDGSALPEERARFVLNRALALVLAGNNLELGTLNRGYGPAMSGTPFAADFQAITQVDGTARDLADVLRRVAVVDDFKAFMDSYRARLKGAKTTAGS